MGYMRQSCGAIESADGTLEWRVWAPKAKEVDLILIDGSHRRLEAMAAEPCGYFLYRGQNVPDGQRYAYSLDKGPDRADPASRWQPEGVTGQSAVLRVSSFEWSDGGWQGIARQDLVFYEIHVGTFTQEGTFDAIIPRLAALRDLGITALELMPVGQFPGERNWGYDGVSLYAPQQSYGGPSGLQRLVNACHHHGLACFLDVVYNHLGPEGNYLSEFGPYFTGHYRTPWGDAVNYDGAGSEAVRTFIIDNARMWIRDYHVDGLRLDAVHAIYDFGARHILEEIKESTDEAALDRGFPAYIVAESDLNDVRLLLPKEQGGYHLDGQWSDDFHHSVHAHLTGERQGYYADYDHPEELLQKVLEDTFALDGCYSRHRDRRHGAPVAGLPGDRFVSCIQNHDQIGNRAAGERLGTLVMPAAQRWAATLLLLAPHLPLLFMGEEYGEDRPFQFFCSFEGPALIEAVRNGRKKEFEAFHAEGADAPDPQSESTFERCRLSWRWEEEPSKGGLRKLYRDLLQARRSWPALRNFSTRRARLHRGPHGPVILELVRGDTQSDVLHTVQVFCNLTSEIQSLSGEELTTLLFSSESTRYGGNRVQSLHRRHLLPYEAMVFGPSDLTTYGIE